MAKIYVAKMVSMTSLESFLLIDVIITITSYKLQITDRPFFWNELHNSFCQSHLSLSTFDLPHFAHVRSSVSGDVHCYHSSLPQCFAPTHCFI